MGKISDLTPVPVGEIDGTETVVMVKAGATRRANLGDVVAATTGPAVEAAQEAADTSTLKAQEATAARDAAVASIGAANIFLTKADADAALAGVTTNAWVRVQADETQGGIPWFYQKVGGAYVSRGAAGAGAVSQIVPGQTLRDDVKRIMRTSNSRGSRARVVWIMDDGYRNNFTVMAPILERRGQVAVIAPEVERIGATYTLTDPAPTSLGTIAHPVVTAADLRELIERGWEVLNHMAQPSGSATLSQVIAGYRAENLLLRQHLTGERVATGNVGSTTVGSVTHPEYADFVVQGGIYRGGVNDPTSDKACRYVFDRGVRDVPAPEADQPLLYMPDGAKPTLVTGYSIDTSGRTLHEILSIIDGIASTDATLIIYGHSTPPDNQRTSTPPCLTESDVEAISRRLYENGIQTLTWSQAFPGNLIHDPRFDNSGASFTVAAGDAAGFSSAPTYLGEARNIVLTATAFRSSLALTCARFSLAVQPFHLYRVRIGYVIDADLTLNGGIGNRNHGLAMSMATGQIGGGNFSAGTSDDWTLNGAFTLSPSHTSATSLAVGTGTKAPITAANGFYYPGQPIRCFRTSDPTVFMSGTVTTYDRATGAMVFDATDFRGTGSFTDWTIEAYRCPSRSTGGQVFFHEALLSSADGWNATLFLGLNQCTGTVRIVHVSVEDMGDFSRCGLTFPTWFNTTVTRNITLPGLNQTGNRRRRWRGELTAPVAAPSFTTVNYAEEDSSAIAAPALNQTVYVLGKGLNAFAGQGGRIGTWNGSAWTFANQPDNSFVRCNSGSQGIGATVRRWYHWRRTNAAGALNVELFSDEAFRDGHVIVNGNVARISCWSGARSDACMLHVFPAWETMGG